MCERARLSRSESSYRLSHVALAAGFAVVITGAITALIADEVASKIAAAALATVAATISGFIARTYLRIYERTLLQPNTISNSRSSVAMS